MAEPINAAVACVATYATCYAFGAAPEAIVMALAGSVAATLWVGEIDNVPKTYGVVLLSTLLGGWGTPLALALADNYIKKHELGVPLQSLGYLAPLIVSVACILVLPYAQKIIRKRIGDKLGGLEP